MLGYNGKFYKEQMPDTLNLAQRAGMALNGLLNTLDKDLDYSLYFIVEYCAKHPYMNHFSSDHTLNAKFAEAIPMMRIMSGDDRYKDIEDAFCKSMLSCIEDGLFWMKADNRRPWLSSYVYNAYDNVQLEDYTNVVGQARMMRALMGWMDVDKNAVCGKLVEEMAEGLLKIAVYKDDYLYYPDAGYGEPFNYPRSGYRHMRENTSEVEGDECSVMMYQGNQLGMLTKWYELSGDPRFLDAAKRHAKYCMFPRFWGGVPGAVDLSQGKPQFLPGQDPPCVAGEELGHWFSHGHGRLTGLRGILDYGIAANDWYAIQFVKRSVEFSMTMAVPRIGWYNGSPLIKNIMEGCQIGDTLALLIRLSDCGAGDYWDDVDGLVRNLLVETQLTDKEQLLSISRAAKEQSFDRSSVHLYHSAYPGQSTSDHVIERSLGIWGSESKPDHIPKLYVMQCCTGNAATGLYYAWESIVREKNGHAQVNLLLNRATKGLVIKSYLPFEGKCEFEIRDGIHSLSFRVPGWVNKHTVKTFVNDNPFGGVQVGLYHTFTGLQAGDVVTVTFDIPDATESYTVHKGTTEEVKYTIQIHGNTVYDISPRNDDPLAYKMYLRDHFKGMKKAEMKTSSIYVPDRLIHW